MFRISAMIFLLSALFISPSWASPVIDLEAIKMIESSGFADAFNPRTKARGLYQITPICLKDFARCTGKSYTSDDLDLFWVNREIADWYFSRRLPQILKSKKQVVTERNLLIGYNAGPAWVGKKKIPKETREYLKKYRKAVSHG